MVKSTAYRHILELEKRGIISYSGKKTLDAPLQKKMRCNFCRIPLVGMIVCGTPDEQEEHITGYLAVPEEWIDGECFLLEAYGDSMVDIGIDEGDLILVKRPRPPAQAMWLLLLQREVIPSSVCSGKTADRASTLKTALTPKIKSIITPRN